RRPTANYPGQEPFACLTIGVRQPTLAPAKRQVVGIVHDEVMCRPQPAAGTLALAVPSVIERCGGGCVSRPTHSVSTSARVIARSLSRVGNFHVQAVVKSMQQHHLQRVVFAVDAVLDPSNGPKSWVRSP